MKIVFATNNEHKLREVRQILNGKYEVLSLADIDCHADIPETADTLDGNALQKARYIYERYGLDVFADDTGLEVEALGGEPGVHTARYAGEAHDTKANVDLLLHNMQGKANRRACFRTAIALIQDGKEHLFEGRIDGEITDRRIGETGFGYDPVFRPEGYDGTFAELGEDVKNNISHRARAVAQLVRYLGLLLCLLLPTGVLAQITDQWQLYPSYGDAQRTIAADGQVWNISSGNLWMLDTESEEITTFDRSTGLSDVVMTRIAYSDEAKCLIAVYENSNIDIINAETYTVTNISAIANSNYSKKDINDILIHGNKAWLSTAFGIVVIDLEECLVLASYSYPSGVNALTIGMNDDAETLYIATPSGIFQRPLSDSQYDTTSLKLLNTGAAKQLLWWNDAVVSLFSNGSVSLIKTDGSVTALSGPAGITQLRTDNKSLFMLSPYSLKNVSSNLATKNLLLANKIQDFVPLNDTTIVAAIGYRGIVMGHTDGNTCTLSDNGYMPTGPRLNNINRLRYANDGTLLNTQGGDDNYERAWYPASLDILRDGQWTNFDTITVNNRQPYHNMTDMVQDPTDPRHHFATSYGCGLFEYYDGHLVNRYTGDNSPLVSMVPGFSDLYTRLGALEYDPQGNLWISMSSNDTALVCLTPSREWKTYYHEGLVGNVSPTRVMSQGDYLWVVSKHHPDLKLIGILCINTKGTPTNFADDRTRWHNNPIVQQDAASYTVQHIFDLAADHDGQIWVGTDMGLFVIPSAEEFMQHNFTYQQIKVNRNDGSGLADYLLSGIWIMDIEVDAANRKWIGTDGQGLYLVSADGQEELEHFTTENSPLPSDHITSLAYNPETGMLMIGTQNGLVSYATNAVQSAETLDEDNIVAYPNPVPPDFNRPINIKGLSADCEVKITTITGQVVYVTHSNGGMAQWNLCNARGQRVATGVYNVVCTNAEGSESVVTRIIVTK